MKILVTGANGYIGSKVVSKLIDLGHEVIAVDLDTNHIDPRAKIYKLNIFENKAYYNIFQSPDVCLHMAWRNGFVHNSDTHMSDLSNHYIFLKNLVDSGIKKIAVMGTMHEAGYFEGKMDELSSTNPISMYGIAKDSLRRSLKLYCKEKEAMFQWLRDFYIFGDDAFGNSIFCKIRQAVKDGKKQFPFTTGKNKYDFIHIDDLVTQISYAVSQNDILGEINVCSGKPVSLSEQIEWYISKNNLPITLEYGKYPDRPYDSPCVYGDDSKIKTIMEKIENTRKEK